VGNVLCPLAAIALFLFVHYAASLSLYLHLSAAAIMRGPYPSPLEFVWQVLLFREGSDLLLFYVIMVALSPALSEVIRRGYWWAVALGSLVIFGLGQYQPYGIVAADSAELHGDVVADDFRDGVCWRAYAPKWDALPLRGKLNMGAGRDRGAGAGGDGGVYHAGLADRIDL